MATSKLQRQFGNMLDKRLPEYRIRENYKPDWLISSDNSRLELDFYIEDIKIAFEVQGAQHFQFIQFFHGTYEGFEKRKRFDEEKRNLCYGHGVKLIEICTSTDAEIAIKEIESSKLPEYKGSYFYADEQYSKAAVHRTNRKKPRDRSNSEEARLKRVEECRQKLAAYERGEIQRDKIVVIAWKDVVANNGFAKSSKQLKHKEEISRQ